MMRTSELPFACSPDVSLVSCPASHACCIIIQSLSASVMLDFPVLLCIIYMDTMKIASHQCSSTLRLQSLQSEGQEICRVKTS